jgi:Tfp pilus assembly protein PilV
MVRRSSVTARTRLAVAAGPHRGLGRAPGAWPGFSLIESTLAILVLDVGVLALTATAASVVGMTAHGAREGGSALVAAGRLERLRASVCADTAAPWGAESEGPYEVRWTVGRDASLRTVQVLVSWRERARTYSVPDETVVECPS